MGKIQEFLEQKDLMPNSKKIYKISIKSFLKYIYSAGDGVDWEDLAAQYLHESRDYRKDLIKLFKSHEIDFP
jgi:hypothetical protein